MSNHKLLIALAACLAMLSGAALAHGPQAHGGTPVVKEQKPWGIAADASAAQRTITIEMGDDMRFKPNVIDVREGEHGWDLVYSDNGVGVPLELQSRIFEPFFTTRRGRGGTGLGLNIVYTVVTQRMGGHLDFWSRPGEGVRLHLKLPRYLTAERLDSQP